MTTIDLSNERVNTSLFEFPFKEEMMNIKDDFVCTKYQYYNVTGELIFSFFRSNYETEKDINSIDLVFSQCNDVYVDFPVEGVNKHLFIDGFLRSDFYKDERKEELIKEREDGVKCFEITFINGILFQILCKKVEAILK